MSRSAKILIARRAVLYLIFFAASAVTHPWYPTRRWARRLTFDLTAARYYPGRRFTP